MIELNLVNPKIEPTVLHDWFILSLWEQNPRVPFMMLHLKRTYGTITFYKLKKVIRDHKVN